MRWWAAVIFLTVVLAAALVYVRRSPSLPSVPEAIKASSVGCREARTEFQAHKSGDWISLRAAVQRLLPDSYGRYRHQRFVLRCPSGQTVLIVNDVSVGRRVPVSVGGRVSVHGQYIWDSRGGLVHFTHHRVGGGPGGWILWRGQLFG